MRKNKQILEELYEKRRELLKQVKSIEQTIIVFGGTIESNSPETPSEYPFRSTIKNKILYTLSKIGEGTANEIAQYMAEQEGKEQLHFFNTVTMIASSMYNSEKIIDARKDGVKNIYFLKEKKEEREVES